MKQFNSATLVWIMSFMLLSNIVCNAETKVPCLIFSGNAEKEYCIDLASFNRITFGNNSMIISSSKDAGKKSIELLYSLFHHLETGAAVPAENAASTDLVSKDSISRIYVDAFSKQLHLITTSEDKFSIGVFNVSGSLLLTSELENRDSVTLEALAPGVYIAIASDGRNKLCLKFILN